MMPLVQVRDFPEELYGELQETAAIEHRSVPQQVIALVERSLRSDGESTDAASVFRRKRQALFAEIAGDPPVCAGAKDMPSDAELVRRGREAR